MTWLVVFLVLKEPKESKLWGKRHHEFIGVKNLILSETWAIYGMFFIPLTNFCWYNHVGIEWHVTPSRGWCKLLNSSLDKDDGEGEFYDGERVWPTWEYGEI
jgi:hypothetical protein